MYEPFHELNQFKTAKFQAMYKVGNQGLHMPPFKGSTFRGTFGSVLKEVACTCTRDRKGNVPQHHEYCVYAYIFETTASLGESKQNDADSVARPFLFQPPDEARTFFAPGETISLGFSLFGKGVEYLPYFIFSLQKMGERGFGRGRHSAELIQVFSVDLDGHLHSIYESTDRLIKNRYDVYSGEDIIHKKLVPRSATDQLSLYFISPARLKFGGKYTDRPEFHVILRAAVRRITSLLYIHHDGVKVDMDFGAFFSEAEKVRLKASDVHWTEWERYSNRQNQRLKMGGIVGEAHYEGDLECYKPWIAIAEHTNIGKNATFGLGRTLSVFQ